MVVPVSFAIWKEHVLLKSLVLVSRSIVLKCLTHDKLVLLAKYLGFLPDGCEFHGRWGPKPK